jgi:hypothetical protein
VVAQSDPNHDVTLGELARGLVALEGRINGQFVGVNHRLDNLSFVSRDVYEVEMKQLREEVEDLKDSKKWMARTLVASLLLPCLVALILWVLVR